MVERNCVEKAVSTLVRDLIRLLEEIIKKKSGGVPSRANMEPGTPKFDGFKVTCLKHIFCGYIVGLLRDVYLFQSMRCIICTCI